MTEAVDDLAAYVGAANVPADQAFVASCLEEGTALVAARVGAQVIPDAIRARAIKEVAADLYHRRRVRNGIANFNGPDLQPMRITRDPMKAAEDILNPYLAPGIA